MEYNEILVSDLENYNSNPDNYCNICFEKHDNSSVKLKCGHKYHYNCIKESYQLNKSSIIRRCPYCRGDGGYLPLKHDNKPIENIHLEYYQCYSPMIKGKSYFKPKCKGIIKSGPNKGKQCTYSCYSNGFCGIHSA